MLYECECCSDTSEGQQLSQLQILNRAQSRQIEELEQKLEDCRRRMRYLEHQFAIVKGQIYKINTKFSSEMNFKKVLALIMHKKLYYFYILGHF